MQIFDEESQDTHAGGSGCACSALMLSAVILPKLASGEWKRVLFVPTGHYYRKCQQMREERFRQLHMQSG